MCGIVGYVGQRPCSELLLDGLKKLEYRGYDSAGLALLEDGSIEIIKEAGKIVALEAVLAETKHDAHIGIGHTRWATHGGPTRDNAHPHPDCWGEIAIVHNGIIENFAELRRELKSRGHRFRSQTDTETIVHLIEECLNDSLVSAVREAIQHLEGSFALVAMCRKEPDRLVVARKDSPLIIGLGEGENFVASDIPAVLNETKNVLVVNDGEMAVVTADGVELMTFDGEPLEREATLVTWGAEAAEKGGYEDFMLKEIHEQPAAIRETLRGRVFEDGTVVLDELELSDEELRGLKKLFFVACGTSYHAGLVGKYVIEHWCRLPVEVDIASEFRYRDPIIDSQTLVVAITQSGETADTLASVRDAKAKGGRVMAITNVVGSTVTRDSDGVIYTHAGPEIGVAATKTFVSQIAAVYALAMKLATARRSMSRADVKGYCNELLNLPATVEKTLELSDTIEAEAARYCKNDDFFFLGRGIGMPVTLEGALKLKEISYIHAEGYPAGELKHGPIALISDGVPVVAVVTDSATREKVISNVQEVKARGASIIAVASEGDEDVADHAETVFYVPKTSEALSAIPAVVPLQLLSYFIAKLRGCDVDQPRNLAKSVTVE